MSTATVETDPLMMCKKLFEIHITCSSIHANIESNLHFIFIPFAARLMPTKIDLPNAGKIISIHAGSGFCLVSASAIHTTSSSSYYLKQHKHSRLLNVYRSFAIQMMKPRCDSPAATNTDDSAAKRSLKCESQ